MAISFKGAHFPPDIILMGVRWYVAYPLSYRHVEELLEERGVPIDHATIQRWVVKYSPLLEEAFHRRKRPVWVSCQLLAQISYPHTPAKERGKACLERDCERMQGGEADADHPPAPPADDARHRPDVPQQAH
jgi:hypothetical protein